MFTVVQVMVRELQELLVRNMEKLYTINVNATEALSLNGMGGDVPAQVRTNIPVIILTNIQQNTILKEYLILIITTVVMMDMKDFIVNAEPQLVIKK